MAQRRKSKAGVDWWKLPFRFAPSLYFQIPVAVVLLVACLFCSVYIFYGHDWHRGEKTPDPTEYDSALLSFWGAIGAPAFIVVIAVLSASGFSGRLTREKTIVLQGIISVLVLLVLCVMLCTTLRQIIVYAPYAMPESSEGMLRPYDETHPWHMRLVPRIQGLCTFYGWLLTLSFSLGLFPVYRSNWEDGPAGSQSPPESGRT